MSKSIDNSGDIKVNLVYKDFDGKINIESVWAEKVGEYYRILNVPFFAGNLAYGDIVSVDEEDGQFYFEELIKPSGHSTVQMVIYDETIVKKIGEELVSLGCDWEGSHLKAYISIDIPPTISYASIKNYLENGFSNKLWDYKEACLAHK